VNCFWPELIEIASARSRRTPGTSQIEDHQAGHTRDNIFTRRIISVANPHRGSEQKQKPGGIR
jgi:hypothetical protein